MITFTSNVVGKVWCAAITDGQSAPSTAEVEDQNNANQIGTKDTTGTVIAAAGSQTCTVAGLVPSN